MFTRVHTYLSKDQFYQSGRQETDDKVNKVEPKTTKFTNGADIVTEKMTALASPFRIFTAANK